MRTRNMKLQIKERAYNSSQTTIVGNLFLIVGTCITLVALIYMLINLDKADSIITMWIPFMVAGGLLSFFGAIFGLFKKY